MSDTIIRLSGTPFLWVGFEKFGKHYTSTQYGSEETVRTWMRARCGHHLEPVRLPKEAWADETYLLKYKPKQDQST